MSEDPTSNPSVTPRQADGHASAGARPGVVRAQRRTRRLPIGRLLLYYAVLILVVGLLAWLVPLVRQAYLSPIDASLPQGGDIFSTGAAPAAVASETLPWRQTLERAATTMLVVLGALLLSLPVAWVYMSTKRLRYDASLVQSVIILPIVIAGVLMIVKNSLALAFSLAGIVAAVRFRNTLKDPKDAVYIFLAIALGLASGVQALDIALVMSLAFNVVVLALWKFNVGALYGSETGSTAFLSIGDRDLLVAQSPAARGAIRGRVGEEADDIKADGVLLVHAADPVIARHAVEVPIAQLAKEWKLVASESGSHGHSTLQYVLKLKKKASAVDLLVELDEQWASHVAAAEFVPIRREKKDEE